MSLLPARRSGRVGSLADDAANPALDRFLDRLGLGRWSFGLPFDRRLAFERIERGLLMGTAIIGTSRPEAVVMLNVIEARTPERLRELAAI